MRVEIGSAFVGMSSRWVSIVFHGNPTSLFHSFHAYTRFDRLCGVRGIGQVAKLLAARAEVHWTRAFGSGTVRQGRCRRERGVKVTVREQQRRRMKHENGEGEMMRYDMRTANTLSQASVYGMSARHARKMCQKKCACDTECVYNLRHHS